MLDYLNAQNKSYGISSNYEDFVDWINNKHTLSAVGGNSYATTFRSSSSPFLVRLTNYSSRTMWGTSWGNYFTDDSGLGNVFRHAVLSLQQFQYTANNNYISYLRIIGGGVSRSSYVSLNRNGYTSSSYGSYGRAYCDRVVYRHHITGKMVWLNPLIMDTEEKTMDTRNRVNLF